MGVIDWEFSYAAPNEFTYSPPWWLLLEQPEYWNPGFEDRVQNYEQPLPLFLKSMVDSEDAMIASGRLREDQRLSHKMRESWESSDFWIAYAARKSFAFDCVYWRRLDPLFFGTEVDDPPGSLLRSDLICLTRRRRRRWDRLLKES